MVFKLQSLHINLQSWKQCFYLLHRTLSSINILNWFLGFGTNKLRPGKLHPLTLSPVWWCPVTRAVTALSSRALLTSRPRSGLFSVSLIDWVVAGRSVLYSYTDPDPIISTTASLIHSTLNMLTMERRKIFTYSPALWTEQREERSWARELGRKHEYLRP